MKSILKASLWFWVLIGLGSCTIQVGTKKGDNPCPMFELPNREPLPKIPDIKGLSQEQVNGVLIGLIKQHRDYIETEHKAIDVKYSTYTTQCKLNKSN